MLPAPNANDQPGQGECNGEDDRRGGQTGQEGRQGGTVSLVGFAARERDVLHRTKLEAWEGCCTDGATGIPVSYVSPYASSYVS